MAGGGGRLPKSARAALPLCGHGARGAFRWGQPGRTAGRAPTAPERRGGGTACPGAHAKPVATGNPAEGSSSTCDGGWKTAQRAGYIQATRAFLILAALAAAVCILSLLASIMSCFQSPVSLNLVASLSAFAAAGCTLVSMAVFSAESWHRNLDGQIQLAFEWSFYLGWAALPLLGLCGIFVLVTQNRWAKR
ncbi:protein NKG7-like isoform X3 [Pelodiscus sinensis]|uniref:protein NKG7-like isoform X3 n=1 Tax=Pelodiscus sinensis TaxID=13735 RepID=UPI003F6A8C86